MKVLTTIPIVDEFVGNVAACWSADNRQIIICWVEYNDEGVLLRLARVDSRGTNEKEIEYIRVDRGLAHLQVTSLHDGRLALLWWFRRIVHLAVYDPSRGLGETRNIGIARNVSNLILGAASDQDLSISWSDTTICHKLSNSSNYITYYEPGQLMGKAGVSLGDSVLRLSVRQDRIPHHVPVYVLEGVRLKHGVAANLEFSYPLLPRIIGESYVYPGEFSADLLGTGGFVISWIVGAHTRNNLVEMQRFTETGEAEDDPVTISAEIPDTHISGINIKSVQERLVASWTRMHDASRRHEIAILNPATRSIEVERVGEWVEDEGNFIALFDEGAAYLIEKANNAVTVKKFLVDARHDLQ